MVNAFEQLVGDTKKNIKIAFIPTAANIEPGDKGWLIEDYKILNGLGYEVDIVDISALNKNVWQPRLEHSNVLFLGGGNTFHLMHWVEKSGLKQVLPKLLKTRVYAGISAGSCIAGPTIYNLVQNLFGEKYDLKIEKGLELVDYHFIPHLNSQYFPKIRKENLEKAAHDLSEKVFALDDNSALVVNGLKREIVSAGTWLSFN